MELLPVGEQRKPVFSAAISLPLIGWQGVLGERGAFALWGPGQISGTRKGEQGTPVQVP